MYFAGYLYLPAPGPLLGARPWLPVLAPNLCLLALARNLYLPALAPNLYLWALTPNLYLPALAYNFITSPRPEFAYANLISSICTCIYGAGLQFVLRVRGLNLHLARHW